MSTYATGGWKPAPEPDVSHLPADCLTNRQLVERIDDEHRRTHPPAPRPPCPPSKDHILTWDGTCVLCGHSYEEER